MLSKNLRNKQVTGFLAVGIALAMAILPAKAEIYTLGDSLSDAGALGLTYTDPTAVSPLTEGKVWVQYLTDSVPAFCNDPNACPLNSSTLYYSKPGNNFAVGGAGVTFDSPDARAQKSYTDLHSQVYALLHGRNLTRDDVVTIWIGANDILDAARHPSSSASYISAVVRTFQSELATLAAGVNGARIFVFTLPDLGTTPLGLSMSDGGKLLTELTAAFNQGISAVGESNVKIIDSTPIFTRLIQVMATSSVYCSKIIDPRHLCGNPSNPLASALSAQAPLLFADPLHPSHAAHQYIANELSAGPPVR